jgi:ABC-2 type transport system permease protein
VKRTLYITGKELLQNRRDGLAALFTIVLPVIFTFFLGLLIGGADQSSFPLAVADSDASATSKALIQSLDDSSLLTIKAMEPDKVDKAVQNQKVAAALVIPQGFGAAVESGEGGVLTFIRIQTSSGAQSVESAVEAVVSQFNNSTLVAKTAAQQVAAVTGAPVDAALLSQAKSLGDSQLASPVLTSTMVDAGGTTEKIAGGFDQSSTGGIVNWVLFGIMGIAGTTVWERKRGLLLRLSGTGVRGREVITGKLLAMIAITLLQQVLLVVVGKFALKVDYFTSPGALVLTMITLSSLAAAVGLLVSVLFRSEQAVVATVVVTAMLMAALGGAWFPLEVTNGGFSQFAHVLPSAWVMDSLHGIVLRTWGVREVLRPLGIVWAWIAGLVAIAIWRYRPD